MSIPRAGRELRAALAFVTIILFAASAHGQGSASEPNNVERVEKDVAAVKAENAALREKIRKIEEQLDQPGDRDKDRYKDGFVLVETEDDSRFPFTLKLNNTTQFRYINTQLESDTFTDHLGTVRPVAERNDFSINRSMFTFSGFVFDKRLKYSLVNWTSNTLAAVVVGGFIGWEFSKAITLQAGYWTLSLAR